MQILQISDQAANHLNDMAQQEQLPPTELVEHLIEKYRQEQAKQRELKAFFAPYQKTWQALSLTGKKPMPGEFIDTNIVIYSLSKEGQKQRKALALLADKPVMSVQVLSETANISGAS